MPDIRWNFANHIAVQRSSIQSQNQENIVSSNHQWLIPMLHDSLQFPFSSTSFPKPINKKRKNEFLDSLGIFLPEESYRGPTGVL